MWTIEKYLLLYLISWHEYVKMYHIFVAGTKPLQKIAFQELSFRNSQFKFMERDWSVGDDIRHSLSTVNMSCKHLKT